MNHAVARLRSALSDQYRIGRELGQGGMATVYLAEDLKHDRKVAVKVLRPELAAVLGADRFVQEIKTTASLQHPHILPLFDSGEADDFLFYVMPYIEGETLRDRLNRETQLEVEEAVRITTEVADALDYAHTQGVIHRDIKPENILLHNGRVMVADFGTALAVSAAADARLTETGLSLGTPYYMSPEQATADRDLTNRSDVYSLGVVLYEMLTGHPPHTGASAQQVVMRIVAEAPPPVSDARTSVPPHVAAAVGKAIEKLPADRFATAGGLGSALNDPTFRTSASAPAGIAPSSSRSRAPVLLTGAAALAGGVVLGALIAGRGDGDVRSVRFVYEPPADQQVVGGRGFAPVIAPDGSRLAYIGGGAGAPHVHVRGLDALVGAAVAGTDDAGLVAFSPDGRSIAFSTRGRLMKLGLDGGAPVPLATTGDVIHGISWTDPEHIVFATGGTVMRTKGDGEETDTIVAAGRDGCQYRWPEALPGGRVAVATCWTGTPRTAELVLVALATGDVRRLALSGVGARYTPTGHLVFVRADGQLHAVPFDPEVGPEGGAVPVLAQVALGEGGLPQFAVSRSGTAVYVPAAELRRQLVLVDRQGRVTPLPGAEGPRLRDPRISPAGDRILLDIDDQVWLYDRNRETLTAVTSGQWNGIYPNWSPDGARIHFSSDAPGSRMLYTVPADGSAEPKVLYDAGDLIWEAEWSSAGSWLAYRVGGLSELETMRDILAVQPGRDEPRLLAGTAHNESMLAVSPDGRWLSYVSDESGRREVYVRPFPDGQGRIQVSADGGTEPVWHPEGGELFYRSDGYLVVARVATAGGFRVLDRQRLFADRFIQRDNYANYDVDPRTGQFVMVEGEGEGTGIVVVTNAVAEWWGSGR